MAAYSRETLSKPKEYYSLSTKTNHKLNDIRELMFCEIGLANVYAAVNDFRQSENVFRKLSLIQKS